MLFQYIITISDSIVREKSISLTVRVMETGRHEDSFKCFDGKRCLKCGNLSTAQILQSSFILPYAADYTTTRSKRTQGLSALLLNQRKLQL